MVLEFYNLREQPFGVTPDPRYLYLSPTHREALASLEYGITSGRGFLGLIAPPGMGKTTILFQLLQRLSKTARTVFIFQTHVTPRDFLRNLMADLGMDDIDGDPVRMQAKLNEMLIQEARLGKRVVVVVDESQNLEDPVLEYLRMLSNFETTSEKLMQIVLAGQTQLADRLASPSLVQLRQRISMMGRLAPFDREETERYICHRLEIAGYDQQTPLFTRTALRRIAETSGGIPRNINNICFNALSLGYVNQQRTIPSDTIHEVVRDLDLTTVKPLPLPSTSLQTRPGLSSRPSGQANHPTKGMLRRWVPRFALGGLSLATVVLGFMAFGHDKWAPKIEHRTASQVAGGHISTETPAMPPTAPATVQPASTPTQTTAPTVPETEPSTSPASGGTPILRKTPAAAKSIHVVTNQTLYSITRTNLGSYNSDNVKSIQDLNPWLTNPDRIRAGQTIRIPEPKWKHDEPKNTTRNQVAEAEQK
jgi:type II secretory pathway predicted ATPase ExeA